MTGPRSRRTDTMRIRAINASGWRNYLERAQQTLRAMRYCASQEDWAAVAAIAPVCAIAATDAVVGRVAGVTARDEDHAAAVELLLVHGSGLEGVQQAAQHLRRLLEHKTLVQYGEGAISPALAQDMLLHAERLMTWVEKQLAD